jgi:hypothetical protein
VRVTVRDRRAETRYKCRVWLSSERAATRRFPNPTTEGVANFAKGG